MTGGVINPVENTWKDGSEYSKAIGGAGFALSKTGGDGPSSDKNPDGTPREPGRPPEDGGDTQEPREGAESESGEKSFEQRYQDTLKMAAEKGLPVVVVFGSQSARDTQKQTTETLQSNIKEGEAVYMYVDTDTLDPNSDLGKVARRNEADGHGLGSSGKSDLAFTGLYKVEQKPDGTLGLGQSTATFWGGRSEISGILKEQLQYAKNGTLKLPGGDTNPDPRPGDDPGTRPPGPPQEGDDSGPGERPDNQPEDKSKRPEDEGGDRSDQDKEDTERRKKQDQEDEERRKELEARRDALNKAGANMGYSLDEYAEGWGKALERAEMEEGPLRDLVDELGRQAITGDVDGEKLSKMMANIGATDQASMDAALEGINDVLEPGGVVISTTVNPETGAVTGIEMSDVVSPGTPKTTFGVNSNGELVSQQVVGTQRSSIPPSQSTLRLAKKAEPAACP